MQIRALGESQFAKPSLSGHIKSRRGREPGIPHRVQTRSTAFRGRLYPERPFVQCVGNHPTSWTFRSSPLGLKSRLIRLRAIVFNHFRDFSASRTVASGLHPYHPRQEKKNYLREIPCESF